MNVDLMLKVTKITTYILLIQVLPHVVNIFRDLQYNSSKTTLLNALVITNVLHSPRNIDVQGSNHIGGRSYPSMKI